VHSQETEACADWRRSAVLCAGRRTGGGAESGSFERHHIRLVPAIQTGSGGLLQRLAAGRTAADRLLDRLAVRPSRLGLDLFELRDQVGIREVVVASACVKASV
jgi:hypothetical protein